MQHSKREPKTPPRPRREARIASLLSVPSTEEEDASELVYERIVELQRAFDRGHMTREEFDARKNQMLWPDESSPQ